MIAAIAILDEKYKEHH